MKRTQFFHEAIIAVSAACAPILYTKILALQHGVDFNDNTKLAALDTACEKITDEFASDMWRIVNALINDVRADEGFDPEDEEA